jgi:phosphotransferase family enzyme
VAKISPHANDELHALLRIAPAAASAGAQVPKVLFSGELGSVPLVLQSALSGRNAALLIEQKRLPAGDLQERIATWLERWGRASAQVRELSNKDLEHFVLSPAIELAIEHGPYLDYLRALCSRAVGMKCPFVASHGDLTAANVLLDEYGDLGIADWEAASQDSLPLMDFFYAAADALAAAQGYADRPGAVAACFAADGERASYLNDVRRRLAGALGVDDVVQEVCFHACWLHHAANEARRSAASDGGPFAAILRALVSGPERFRLVAPVR